jgi:hypothetical protein
MNTNKPTEIETLRAGYEAARLEIESRRAAQPPSSAKGVAHG